MSENGLTSAQHKMRDAGVAEQAITVFTHYYQSLEAGATGLIPEETIEPLRQVASVDDVGAGTRGAEQDGPHPAQRGAGHLDGPGSRQVPSAGP